MAILHCPEILAKQKTFFLFCPPVLLTMQDDSQTAEVIHLFDVVPRTFKL